MSMPKYAQRRDANEPEILRALRGLPGLQVWKLGRPCDWVMRYRGKLFLIEIDNPASKYRKRDPEQLQFLAEWEVPLVRTIDDALRVLNA